MLGAGTYLLFYTHLCYPSNTMVGLGLCLCCRTDQLLTEHYAKEIKEKIMICQDCHSVMDAYVKVVERYGQMIAKERQSQAEKGSQSQKKDD